jgi:hypothetical protein
MNHNKNGVAQRWNHTLIDMVRSILSNSTLSLSVRMWMEALKTIMHIINHVSSNQSLGPLMNCGPVG